MSDENKPKHTPEPWEYDRGFTDSHPLGGSHSTIDDPYLTVYCGQEACDDFNPDKHDYIQVLGPNQEANAALIAAAPELLEAVNKALEFIEQRIEAEFHINCSEATDSLYKAIAKAEGK